MQTLYFSSLYSGTNWLRDVRMTVDSAGEIVSIEDGVTPPVDVLGDVPGDGGVLGPALPAMANVHSHAFQRAAVGMTEFRAECGEDFWSWRKAIYGIAARISPTCLRSIAAGLYLEMLKAGYTAVGEFHYLHNAHLDQSLDMSMAIIDGAADAGIALTHLPVLYEYAGFGRRAAEDGQQAFYHAQQDYIRFHSILGGRIDGINRLGMAFHSLRAVDVEDMAGVLAALGDGMPVHIHIAEQLAEVEACVAHTGRRPVELLAQANIMGPDWTLIHATHINDDEIAAMIDAGVVAGLCPTTEANLGDGIFPASRFVRRGGSFAIGSDSHVSVDPREELRLLEYSQRLVQRRRTVLTDEGGGHTGEFLWRRAALGGARSLGQNIGELVPGRRADLIVLDDTAMSYTGVGFGQVMDTLVFAGQPNPVRSVMVAGNWVVRNGKHRDEDRIVASYREAVAALASELEV